MELQLFSARHHQPRSGRSVPHCAPGSQAPSEAAAPGSACVSVLGSSRTERVRGHEMVFKGGTLGDVFAVSVGDVRTTRPGFLQPGPIRSQAEGGMPLSSKSHTGQRGKTPPYTRVYGTACAPARPIPAKRLKVSEQK